MTQEVMKNLSNSLGMEALIVNQPDDSLDEVEVTDANEIAVVSEPKDDSEGIQQDFETARKSMLGLVAKGETALGEILALASLTESARVFEVATTMMNSLASINKDILEMRRKKIDTQVKIAESQGNKTPTNVTNNNLFVGSTKDLQEIIRKASINHDNNN